MYINVKHWQVIFFCRLGYLNIDVPLLVFASCRPSAASAGSFPFRLSFLSCFSGPDLIRADSTQHFWKYIYLTFIWAGYFLLETGFWVDGVFFHYLKDFFLTLWCLLFPVKSHTHLSYWRSQTGLNRAGDPGTWSIWRCPRAFPRSCQPLPREAPCALPYGRRLRIPRPPATPFLPHLQPLPTTEGGSSCHSALGPASGLLELCHGFQNVRVFGPTGCCSPWWEAGGPLPGPAGGETCPDAFVLLLVGETYW